MSDTLRALPGSAGGRIAAIKAPAGAAVATIAGTWVLMATHSAAGQREPPSSQPSARPSMQTSDGWVGVQRTGAQLMLLSYDAAGRPMGEAPVPESDWASSSVVVGGVEYLAGAVPLGVDQVTAESTQQHVAVIADEAWLLAVPLGRRSMRGTIIWHGSGGRNVHSQQTVFSAAPS